MLIAIDESGSFVRSTSTGSWCVVAGYTFTERRKTANLTALQNLKRKYGRSVKQEVKLKDLAELDYFAFLENLCAAGGALFAVGTDGALADPDAVARHRDIQAENIRKNIPKMKYEGGKMGIATLANELQSLSLQLYIQLVCQVVLLSDLIRRGVLYHVQRDPVTLRRFVWRIDQKNTEKSTFETAFEKVAPGLLQSQSFKEPAIFLTGADYSHFRPFEFTEEQYPQHLQNELGRKPQSTVNIGKILRDDMQFPDSKTEPLVQIADLLAAGIRRCLRGEFSNNKKAAALVGKLMVENVTPKPPISLIHLSELEKVTPDSTASRAILEMEKNSQSILRSV
jgi:hypothetical protein